jgi:hypothetical protein
MERVEKIKDELETLIVKAIDILEKNYDLDIADDLTSASMTVMALNDALIDLDDLDEKGLKIED